jgi:hypothetical protein
MKASLNILSLIGADDFKVGRSAIASSGAQAHTRKSRFRSFGSEHARFVGACSVSEPASTSPGTVRMPRPKVRKISRQVRLRTSGSKAALES